MYWISCHTLIDSRLCSDFSTATSVYFGVESSKLGQAVSGIGDKGRGGEEVWGGHESGVERGVKLGGGDGMKDKGIEGGP